MARLATKLGMVPAERCGFSRVLLLGVLWGGAARLTVSGAAAVTSALFRGEGSDSFGEASYLCLEVLVVGEVVLRRSRDCGNRWVGDLYDLVGHVGERVEVHGIGGGGEDHAHVGRKALEE